MGAGKRDCVASLGTRLLSRQARPNAQQGRDGRAVRLVVPRTGTALLSIRQTGRAPGGLAFRGRRRSLRCDHRHAPIVQPFARTVKLRAIVAGERWGPYMLEVPHPAAFIPPSEPT